MSSLLVIFVGVVKKFCRFWIWSETEFKTPAEYGLQHNSTPSTPPPPPTKATHCLYTAHLVWEGGRGGGKREGRWVTVHKYSSFVYGGNSSPAGSKIQTTLSECISSLKNLLNTSPLTGQLSRKAEI